MEIMFRLIFRKVDGGGKDAEEQEHQYCTYSEKGIPEKVFTGTKITEAENSQD